MIPIADYAEVTKRARLLGTLGSLVEVAAHFSLR